MKPYLIALLSLFIFGCGLSAAPRGIEGRLEAANPTPTPAGTIIARVCTQLPSGHLNIRIAAGLQHAVTTTLAENTAVILSGSRQVIGRSEWAEILNPVQGWLNARFLCEDK